MITFYVSPNGTGNGTNTNNPALYTSTGFWQAMQTELSLQAVTVRFLNGMYDSPLPLPTGMGHPHSRLILQGQSEDGVVFRIPDDDPSQDDLPLEHSTRILFEDCQNILLQQFLFTGNGTIDYVTRLTRRTQDVLIEGCTFADLPGVRLGATGVYGANVHHVTFQACHFRTVGYDSHAHMIYNATDSQQIKLLHCTFEDCAGDYVRFRDNVDESVVHDCSFISSGTYPKDRPVSQPFIAMALFNDCKPGTTTAPPDKPTCPDPLEHIQYEYFGTNYVITNNKFSYQHHPGLGDRYAIAFYHFGFDPPGRNHLMTDAEGQILEHGTPTQRKALLKKNCGIDGDRIKLYDNQYNGVDKRVAFGSEAAYGACSKGWEGYVEIHDLVKLDQEAHPPQWLEAFLTLSSFTKG
jgi:hypothetical protein